MSFRDLYNRLNPEPTEPQPESFLAAPGLIYGTVTVTGVGMSLGWQLIQYGLGAAIPMALALMLLLPYVAIALQRGESPTSGTFR
jgi:hypothetical protein